MWNARQIAIVHLASVRQAGLDFAAAIDPLVTPRVKRHLSFDGFIAAV